MFCYITAIKSLIAAHGNFSYFHFLASFNITSDILRTGQTLNVTVWDSCNGDYEISFGDGAKTDVSSPQKIASYQYASAGIYTIQVTGTSHQSAPCQSSAKSVTVRDPIKNMVRNSFFSVKGHVYYGADHEGMILCTLKNLKLYKNYISVRGRGVNKSIVRRQDVYSAGTFSARSH